MKKAILSIRGGGIRGIIPCCAIEKLEADLGGLAGDHIAFCAGTSTGALLTAALAAGVPASKILTVYTERSKEIFTPRGPAGTALRLARGWQYDPKNLQKVLASTFGGNSSWALNDCLISVMIPAVDMSGHTWYFTRDGRKNSRTTGTVLLVDAAVASASAPTYFGPWTVKLPLPWRGPLQFFDGGASGYANPAYQACVEAFEYDDFKPEDSILVDLGTGYYPSDSKAPCGLLGTVEWVLDTLLDSAEDAVTGALDRQWPGIRKTLNPGLPNPISMDDLNSIPDLVQIGKQFASTLDWKKILGLS